MMTASLSPKHNPNLARIGLLASAPHRSDECRRAHQSQIGSGLLESHLGSVLVLTEDDRVLYATGSFHDGSQDLKQICTGNKNLADEITLICQVLKQCRNCFPSQNWAIEFDIFTKEAGSLQVRSRWLKLDKIEQPCILIVIEDRQQLIQDIVVGEAEDWGLTAREREVWLLHQDGRTYRQIAEALYITINTVKKHMRSIHAKRRSQADYGD